jgi:hypothetical protein
METDPAVYPSLGSVGGHEQRTPLCLIAKKAISKPSTHARKMSSKKMTTCPFAKRRMQQMDADAEYWSKKQAADDAWYADMVKRRADREAEVERDMRARMEQLKLATAAKERAAAAKTAEEHAAAVAEVQAAQKEATVLDRNRKCRNCHAWVVTRPGARPNGEFVCDSDACAYMERMRAAAKNAKVQPRGTSYDDSEDEEHARRPFDEFERDYCREEDYDY